MAEYGQVIVDECHHKSAFTFEQVMRQVKAECVVGLTATPTRKDGRHPIICMRCGPVRFSMRARTIAEATPFEHKMTPRHTNFRVAPELTDVTIQDLYAALVGDASRNQMIASHIDRTMELGRCPPLPTGRTEHLKYFATEVAGVAKHVFVLKGGMGKGQRRDKAAALAAVPKRESRVILGCRLNCDPNWLSVFSPPIASTATRALNSGLYCFLVLVIDLFLSTTLIGTADTPLHGRVEKCLRRTKDHIFPECELPTSV